MKDGTFQENEKLKTPADQLDQELARETVKRTDRLKDNNIDLALRVKEARDFLTWSTAHMRGAWLDWVDQANGATKEITMLRMTLDRESKSVCAASKDVVTLFNSPEYLAAHERFKELIGLLDRFSKLNADGTMEAFGDFILKVTK